MQIFESLTLYKKQFQHCVATIGKYDGMHLGHQSLLNKVLSEAKALNLPSVVILSEPQPEEFFLGRKASVRLTLFRDKIAFLEKYGIDIVYCLRFDAALSQMTAENFIDDVLCAGLGIKGIIVGDDFHFGKNRKGDFSLLKNKGEVNGFLAKTASTHYVGEERVRVSSTLVRNELARGHCEKVKQLLGRFYSISGEVIKGKQLGREIGTPTANVKLERDGLPLQGIYIVYVHLHGKNYQGVASIGYNPTVNDEPIPALEVFIFDFSEEIYGEMLCVEFVKKIRNEEKFVDIKALQERIAIDKKLAREFFNNE